MNDRHNPSEQAKPEHLLSGRVVLVTGASRGIGAATAKLLAQSGAAVGVNYHHSADAAQRVVASIEQAGGQALAVQADARDETQVEALVKDVQAVLGPIDTLVLNATTARLNVAPLLEQTQSVVMGLVEDQLKLALTPLRAVVPGMLQRQEGCVVAVSSELARVPQLGMGTVGIAKAAEEALLRSLVLELGPQGVRVNVVAPGLVLTDLNEGLPQEALEAAAAHNPLRRNAVPEDVAGAILLLVSAHAGFVTGGYLPLGGGSYIP